MFTSERHEQILCKLQEDGKVKVKELSELFNVSEDCIRKDLKQLEAEGHLKRAYGGAIINQSLSRNVFARVDKDANVKKEIAKKAYDLIAEGETIFLDISTTNIYLAQLLAVGNKPCIILSNMIEILQILAKNPLLTVIGTGGNVNLELNGFVGAMTLNIIEHHHFDCCFIGTLGISEDFKQLTTFDLDDGLIKEAAIAHAKRKYVVMDAKKFNSMGNYRFASVQKIDAIITDSKLSSQTKKQLKLHNINYL